MIWDKLKEIEEKLDRLLDDKVEGYEDPGDEVVEDSPEQTYPEEPAVSEKVPDVPTPEEAEEATRAESRAFDLKHAHTPPPEKVVKKKYVPKEDDLDIPDEKGDFKDW